MILNEKDPFFMKIHSCKLGLTSKEILKQIIRKTGTICNLQFIEQVVRKMSEGTGNQNSY